MRFTVKNFLFYLLATVTLYQQVNAGHLMTAKEPIGVMVAHSHHQGGWMLSYRFMRMAMDGNREATDSVSTPLPGFMVSPLKMTMDIHMLGGMYGVSEPVEVQLPYPMQLGSGTYDLLPGVTWLKHSDGSLLGVQASATLRLGDNDNGYTLGDRYLLTAWYSHQVTSAFSSSVRVAVESWGNIDGSDDQLNPMMVPTARTDLRAGHRLDLFVGASWDTGGHLDGHRLAIEVGVPVYQDLDGPQLENDLMFTFGWQGLF